MKKYNKEELEKIAKESFSVADMCRSLGIRPNGGNYKTLKKYFRIFNINILHFTGQGWNVGKRYRNFGKTFSLEEILIEKSTYASTTNLKQRLIKDGLKEDKCEKCGLIDWNGEKISLHLDHINGDNLDNRIENLKILCPNCHSQTNTYGFKNKNKSSLSELRQLNFEKHKDLPIYIKKKNERKIKLMAINFCKCGKQIKYRSKTCVDCYAIKQRKVKDRPDKQKLLKMINETSLEAVGRKYNVSGKAVKKWLK